MKASAAPSQNSQRALRSDAGESGQYQAAKAASCRVSKNVSSVSVVTMFAASGGNANVA